MNNQTWAIILAAGSGSRLASASGGIPKQYLEWRQRPLYWHSALAMSRACCVDGLVFVFPEQDCAAQTGRICELALLDSLGLEWKVTPGGERRQDSAAAAISCLPPDCARVLIHDAARCFLKPALVRTICARLDAENPVVVPTLPVTDTVKLVSEESPDLVAGSLPRNMLRAVQTPQGFMRRELAEAHAKAQGFDVTDDAMLLEQLGYPVRLVPGDPGNMKITNPEDLARLAETPASTPCSGFGYDVHRYGNGNPLRLGGVMIPGDYQVIAHSDGDVLLHSLIDALLGAASLGDIGTHFPDSDERYRGISSALLLDRALELVARENVKICHVDLTVVAQAPKLAPYAEEIRRNVARLMGLPEKAVNFKATTEEGLGFTGRREGIKAYALVNGSRRQLQLLPSDQAQCRC